MASIPVQNASSGIVQFPSIVSLNVGGSLFTTRLSTLLSCPDSMLATMFSGSYPLDQDSEGRYFLDREGKHFSYILNYLRDPIKFTISLNDIPPVLVEAEYYQISSLMDLLRGHPSQIGAKIIKRYREYLGPAYTKLKQSVILSIANKRHLSATPFNTCPLHKPTDQNVQTRSHVEDEASDDSQSYAGETLIPQGDKAVQEDRVQRQTLRTDVMIAMPIVIFENNIDSQSVPQNTFTHSLRRIHQRPYNACLADGHDFKDTDIVSTYWQKSEVWDLLLHDLKSEINTNIRLKMENNTLYCRRCMFQHQYGVCRISIYWLKIEYVPHCSTQESTQYITSQETTPYNSSQETNA